MYRRRHRKGGGIKFVGPPSDDVISMRFGRNDKGEKMNSPQKTKI